VLDFSELPQDKLPHIFEPKPLHDAMLYEFSDDDYHFVTYFVPGEEVWPAMAKNVLGLVHQQGGEILTQLLVLDLDTEPHEEWTPETLDSFGNDMGRILNDPSLPKPAYLYTTAKGARMVFILERPVPVEEGEPLHRGLCQLFSSALRDSVVDVDPGSNWERCFRLPRVKRGDTNTWEQSYFHFLASPNERLSLDAIEPVGPKACTLGGIPEELDLPMPTPEEVKDILTVKRLNNRVQSSWYKFAKQRLKGRDAYGPCFEDEDPPPPGQRDTAIQKTVGCIVGMMVPVEEASPEKCYALLYDWVSKIHPSECKMPPDENLWRAVLKYWAKEKAKYDHEKAVTEAEAEEKIDSIVQGMRDWCGPLKRITDANEARQYALRRLLAFNGKTTDVYIMQPNGYYSSVPVSHVNLRAAILDRHMEDLIGLQRMDGDRVIELRPSDLLETYGVAFGVERARIGVKGTHLSEEGCDGGLAIVHGVARLNSDLKPKFHPEVDVWLRKLFGSERYFEAEQWIANALCIDEGMPICALSMCGPPSAGKKMFAQGLAECIDTFPESAAGAEVFGKFTNSLRHAPFIVIDEGLPNFSPNSGLPALADTFRRFVSGDPVRVEEKYRPTIVMKCPYRVIFTSNNPDTVEQLAGTKGMSSDDVAALGLRLLHFTLNNDAAAYLMQLGGRAYTGREGAKWICSDHSFDDSDFIVARHMLWIMANKLKPQLRGNRLLVEGNPEADILAELRVNTGNGTEILTAIMSVIEATQKAAFTGYAEDAEGAYITTKEVMDQYGRRTGKQINSRHVNTFVRKFSVNGAPVRREFLLASGKTSGRMMWWWLDEDLLVQECERIGIPCRHLLERRDIRLEARHGDGSK
jgi:hypothetical protein